MNRRHIHLSVPRTSFVDEHFYRQAEHGDEKTDDNDLDAIFRAAVNGFGLLEKPIDSVHHQRQILARHRRDLVKKRAKLQCQIRHHLELALPGFGALFDGDDLWTQTTSVPLLEAIAQRLYRASRALRRAAAINLP